MKIAYYYFIEEENRIDEFAQDEIKKLLELDLFIVSKACNVLEHTQYPYIYITELD